MDRQAIIDRLAVEMGTISSVKEVYTEFITWDDVQSERMPCIVIVGGDEDPTYEGKVTVDYYFEVILWGYITSNDSRESTLNALIGYMRDKIHEDKTTNGLTLDRQIRKIRVDEGWAHPKGIVEMTVNCWVHDVVASR